MLLYEKLSSVWKICFINPYQTLCWYLTVLNYTYLNYLSKMIQIKHLYIRHRFLDSYYNTLFSLFRKITINYFSQWLAFCIDVWYWWYTNRSMLIMIIQYYILQNTFLQLSISFLFMIYLSFCLISVCLFCHKQGAATIYELLQLLVVPNVSLNKLGYTLAEIDIEK